MPTMDQVFTPKNPLLLTYLLKREFVAKYMFCYKYFSQNGEKSPQIYCFGAG